MAQQGERGRRNAARVAASQSGLAVSWSSHAMGAAINANIGGFGVKITRTPVPVIAWTNAPNQASSYAVAPRLAGDEQSRRGEVRDVAVSDRPSGVDESDPAPS